MRYFSDHCPGLLLVLSALLALSRNAGADWDDVWVQRVEPVLKQHCVKCHGGVRQRGGLDVRSLVNLLRGGEQETAIRPGSPDASLLYQYVNDGVMPPDEDVRLSEDDVAVIAEWIRELPPRDELLGEDVTASDWPTQYWRALKARRASPGTVPAGASPSSAIDGFIRHRREQLGITPAEHATDRTLVRRLYLDLAGRIPSQSELAAVLRSDDADRIPALVDQLLQSPEYARHMREVFDVVLMGRPPKEVSGRRGPPVSQQRIENGWYDYLEHVFRCNIPWNQIVYEIVAARPQSAEDRGAVWFLYERRSDHQAMAEAVAPIAFGYGVACAQCHNHPLAWEVEQRHYWGLVTAFNRSEAVRTENGIGMAESAVGGFVSFSNLENETQPALMTLPIGMTIEEQRPATDAKEVDAPELYLVPPPENKQEGSRRGRRRRGPSQVERVAVPVFSRRLRLAEAVTHENPLLARAFVNRIWTLLMGYGLVHPVNQMDEKKRPSHPDLLTWLAEDFESNGYDIRRLIRSIVLSGTYQLDSRWSGDHPPRPETFARSLDKPLSAEQLFHSFLVATGNGPDTDGKIVGHNEATVLDEFVETFPDLFPEQYNASVMQGMFLTNSGIVNDLLQPESENTAGRLTALSDTRNRILQAYDVVLGRSPSDEELKRLSEYLARRSVDDGVRQMLWALLSSSEFLVNH